MSKVWDYLSIKGGEIFILKENLKVLKEALRKWNKKVFGILDLEVDKAVIKVNELETLEVGDKVRDVEHYSKCLFETVSKMWQTLVSRESILRKKSRHKWIEEGDSN